VIALADGTDLAGYSIVSNDTDFCCTRVGLQARAWRGRCGWR
jgi:hypothetical protein